MNEFLLGVVAASCDVQYVVVNDDEEVEGDANELCIV